MSLKWCYFCQINVSDSREHVAARFHQQNMLKFAIDDESADKVVRNARPSEDERQKVTRCIDVIQRKVQPTEVHPSGSIGKGTALKRSHDFDFVLVLGSFDSQNPKGSVTWLAERLRGSEVYVHHKEKHLLKAYYRELELDLLPTGHIDVERLRKMCEPEKNGWRGAIQIQHTSIISQMAQWRKDVVRLLKAWVALKIAKMPGLILEILVRELPIPNSDKIRTGFRLALQQLSRGKTKIVDPFREQRDVAEDFEYWHEVTEYANDTLSLLGWVEGSAAQPNHLRNCASKATFSQSPSWHGAHKQVARGTYTEGARCGDECVVKWFKTGAVYSAANFDDDLRACAEARRIAAQFNQAKRPGLPIYINEAQVWHRADPDAYGRIEKLLVEPMIKGIYKKFNSNTGFQASGYDLMAALSHFSYHFTRGSALLCDLQGGCYHDCYVLTDPVIMSPSQKYGATDLGQDGIDNFFFYHQCSSYCDSTWSRSHTARPLFQVCEGTSMACGGEVQYGSSGVQSRRHANPNIQLRTVEEENDHRRQSDEVPLALVLFGLLIIGFLFLSMVSSPSNSRY
mmetsp:Transcript_29081/g.56195  ORF Transcript_29081/g.56195 Transcript_29081/m.56195 type:complete len:569 (-) Transcript_29081:168-1874(-)